MPKNSKFVTACELCAGKCWTCQYADSCGDYQDQPDLGIPMVEVEDNSTSVSVALCQGRHEIPEATDGAIFGQTVDPLDVNGLQEQADSAIASYAENGVKSVNLYVTGLTVALIAVLNACRDKGLTVTLYHYDRESSSYYKQEVK